VAYWLEKRKAVIVAAVIGIFGYGGSWFLYTPLIPWLQTVASGLMGLSAAGLWMLHSSIGADIIDYDELNTGKRREGSFTGCSSYILKLGNSLGGLLAGSVLKFAHFDHSLAVQTPQTIFWIRAMLAGIPVLGLIFVIFFITRVHLTKQKCAEIRCALEARRGVV
jgi:GPH family glycoside/pentoside/hexuronide:cation symporter